MYVLFFGVYIYIRIYIYRYMHTHMFVHIIVIMIKYNYQYCCFVVVIIFGVGLDVCGEVFDTCDEFEPQLGPCLKHRCSKLSCLAFLKKSVLACILKPPAL